MSPDANRVVRFTIVRESGTIREILTNSPEIDHFLRKVKTGQSIHTWINYAHDLKTFFSVIDKLPEAVDRRDCVVFMEQQDEAGLSTQTINRRLAALSSLFTELHLLDPARFPQNPVSPFQRGRRARKRSQSLYRGQPDRIPDVVPEKDLQTFFNALPTWRDRTLMLLMWVSCLRIGDYVG
jgi:site-specific recombinase XerC